MNKNHFSSGLPSSPFHLDRPKPADQPKCSAAFREYWDSLTLFQTLELLYSKEEADIIGLEDYAMFSFAGVPWQRKVSLLLELAQGRQPTHLCWPLVALVFFELPHREPSASPATARLAQAIIRGFRRLTAEQQAVVFQPVFSIFSGSPRLADDHIDHAMQAWQIDVLAKTVGTLLAPHAECFPPCDTILRWLGIAPLESVSLELDFRTKTPLPISSQPGLLLPDVSSETKAQITLFMHPITQAAEKFVPPMHRRSSCSAALVYEFTRTAFLHAADLDGFLNPPVSSAWTARVAKYFTWQWAKSQQLDQALKDFMDLFVPPGAGLGSLVSCPLEAFRVYLWFLRQKGARRGGRDFQNWIRSAHPELPPLPNFP